MKVSLAASLRRTMSLSLLLRLAREYVCRIAIFESVLFMAHGLKLLAGSTSMTGSRHGGPPMALLLLKQLTAMRQGHSELFSFQGRNLSIAVLAPHNHKSVLVHLVSHNIPYVLVLKGFSGLRRD
jgi:hypothetical protein